MRQCGVHRLPTPRPAPAVGCDMRPAALVTVDMSVSSSSCVVIVIQQLKTTGCAAKVQAIPVLALERKRQQKDWNPLSRPDRAPRSAMPASQL